MRYLSFRNSECKLRLQSEFILSDESLRPASLSGRQVQGRQCRMGFAKVRLVIDTTLKNSQNVLEALRVIARNEFALDG